MITKIEQHENYKDKQKPIENLKIAVIGNVDSGKSTLVGVLTTGQMDDGRGQARQKVFNYIHEQQNGRTSSIAQEIMGFDKNLKQMLPERMNQNKNKNWSQIVDKSDKIVNFLDLCGHEKYLKTTMFGMIGLCPDFAMIMIGTNMGITRMTKEHLGITLALKMPFFVVLTKIDLCPENIYQENVANLFKILKSGLVNRMPILIKENNDEEITKCAQNIASDRICPIFPVSNVKGDGIENLTKFISQLKRRNNIKDIIDERSQNIEFYINEKFVIGGVGLVLSGLVKSGTIKANQILLLGPENNGNFRSVLIKSIHVNRVAVSETYAGECASLNIKAVHKDDYVHKDDLKKGMMLLDPLLKPVATQKFQADIVVLHHSSTIKVGYQAVMHCGVIRQAVAIEEIFDNKEFVRTGDKALINFKFLFKAEYLKIGQTVLLRDGRTKILGVITQLYKKEKEDEKKQIFLKKK